MIALACDHGALDLKKAIMAHLDKRGLAYKDFGCYTKDSCDYPDFAGPAAQAVASGECDRGIVCCTTGIGVSITANKVKGIRCALLDNPMSARLTREHNDTNMMALGAAVTGEMLALEIARGAVSLEEKTILPLAFTMSRDAAAREKSYRAAASLIEAELRRGHNAAMVNLGDVSVYATAYYILDIIRADGYETVMAPGVTSFCAVAARLGQSLTEMEQPLQILPGSLPLDEALRLPGTKVLMKSGSAVGETVAALERCGLLDRAALVADCGLPTEQVYHDLRALPPTLSYFATILVR